MNLMNLNKESKDKGIVRVVTISGITLLYVATAWIGQQVAIPSSNVIALWLPSGIMLGLVLLRGYNIWSGIFLGAIASSIWKYYDLSSFNGVLSTLLAAISNGIGDVLSAVGGAWLIRFFTGSTRPFSKGNDFALFIVFGVIAGPAVSAFLGVTGLCITGILSWEVYRDTLLIWFTGDGIGSLLIAPAVVLWIGKERTDWTKNRNGIFLLSVLLVSASLCWLFFCHDSDFQYITITLIFIILIWSVLRLPQGVTALAMLFVSTVAVVSFRPSVAYWSNCSDPSFNRSDTFRA